MEKVKLGSMFRDFKTFNQPIGKWDVSSVTNMWYMFAGFDDGEMIFNQPLNEWDVSNVENMDLMFYRSTSFNQDISNWCVTQITSEPQSFSQDSPLTEENKPKWGTCPGG